MHSYIITGGSFEDRKNIERDLCHNWKAEPYDIFRINVEEKKQLISIDDIRLMQKNLSMSPRLSPVVVGIIDQSDKLSLPAQHALLKTLEEPPQKARLILETENNSLLLPTILSRCQTISVHTPLSLSDEKKSEIVKTLDAMQKENPGKIAQDVTRLFDKKETGVQYLTNLLQILHEQLCVLSTKTQQNTPVPWNSRQIRHIIRSALRAQKLLSANVHTTLIFDEFFRTITLDKQ